MGILRGIFGPSTGSVSTGKLDRVLNAGGKTTETQAKYQKLEPKTTVKQLVYPSNLLKATNGMGHFILFNFNYISGSQFKSKVSRVENGGVVKSPYGKPVVYDQQANSARSSMLKVHKRSDESIAIYMPENITSTYSADWQSTELGIAGRLIKATKNFDNLTLDDVGNTLTEEAKNLVTGAIQTLTPINAKDAAELLTGTISNPFVEVLFKGVNNREFSYQFKFVPKNQNEAKTVREIIRRFKFHMMPEYKYKQNDSSYLLHPSTVDLTFMKIDSNGVGERNGWLHRMSTCAISNVSVDDAPDGYTVHDDDAPVATVMDITLIELEQLHKGRFLNPGDTF